MGQNTTPKTACFLSPSEAALCADSFGTPCYIYDEAKLRSVAETALRGPSAFGLSVRYAMKACPNASVLRLFDSLGVLIDASSGFEVERAMRRGIAPSHIQITAQEYPRTLPSLVEQGVLFNACSLSQLERFGRDVGGKEVSIRVNPGLGSGGTNRTNTGGPASSFGIWHEQLDDALAIAKKHSLRVTGLHSHIGSGSDVAVWERCADLTLAVAERMPEVVRLSLGGGFKIARMPGEKETDLHAALAAVKARLERFAERHGRKLHLEIEPGTYLVANAGAILARVVDVVRTGADGYTFVKIDSGMTEILRPSLYGAQHPIWIFPRSGMTETVPTVVVGHCCESGDILTPAPGDSEALLPRELPACEVDDLLVIGGAGAYCAAMPAKNYNSFPEAPEVFRRANGSFELVRRRQTLDQILENEIPLDEEISA